MTNKDISLKITNDLDISLNILNYKDFSTAKSNLSYDSLIISSYESLYNDNETEVISYQSNYLSFIDHDSNIIPLTYNPKNKNGILRIEDDHIISVNIDNFTVNDSSILPRQKTIELTYECGPDEYVMPVNIIDSYSYIIDSYNYENGNNKYSYEIEYNYSLYTYYAYTYYDYEKLNNLGYTYNSYSYYLFSYDFKNDDLNISYNIKYTYNDLTYTTYSYNYFYTYAINQFENDFIYVNQDNLDKADFNIGLFKSDLDTMNISYDLLNVNSKYTDIIYLHNIEYYKNVYRNLNSKYNDLLLKSSIINSYIFNYKPYEELILSFDKYKDILYFDINKKEKVSNKCNIEISKNIDEFNICIPFEYSYKSYIEDINPIDINKILINILRKKPELGSSKDFIFDYNNLFDSNFQTSTANILRQKLNTFYNLNYGQVSSLNNYTLLTDNEIELNIEKSYLIENRVEKYESNRYFGKCRYVFNFKINKEKFENDLKDYFHFDILMFIKDIVLGDNDYNDGECNAVNENYKIMMSFYIDLNTKREKTVQTYDIIYHDYNFGFNFDKHGEMLGICFMSENINQSIPKPVFVKYNHYDDFVKVNLNNLLSENNENSLNTCSSLQLVCGKYKGANRNVTFSNGEITVTPTTIKEEYDEDKIFNLQFNYFKKDININPNNTNAIAINLTVNRNNNVNRLQISGNNYQNFINRIFNNKSIFNPIRLNKYFNEVYNLKASGLRNGDYYIPTVNEYYMMDLYNILSIYNLNNYKLISCMINNYKPILVKTNDNCKINYLYYSKEYTDNCYVLPIFKLPDYSIINNGEYDIIYDKDINCESVTILDNGLGYFSLRVKKYYNFMYSGSSTNPWKGDSQSSNVSAIQITATPLKDTNGKDTDNINLNVIYSYTKTKTDNDILYFNIGYIDSDPSMNTTKIANINCRILCKVIAKIKH